MNKIYVLSIADTIIGAYTDLAKAKEAINDYVDHLAADADSYEEALDAADRNEPFTFVVKIVHSDQHPTTSIGQTLNEVGTIVGTMVRDSDDEITVKYSTQSASEYLDANDLSLVTDNGAYVDPDKLVADPDNPVGLTNSDLINTTDPALLIVDNTDEHAIYRGGCAKIAQYLKEKIAGKTELDK